jgi:superfamily II DNA/RNA helicase
MLFFSATYDSDVMDFAKAIVPNPVVSHTNLKIYKKQEESNNNPFLKI